MSFKEYCFTWNNPDHALDILFKEITYIKYAVWQGEIGDKGTYHYQGYIELKRGKLIIDFMDDFPNEMHFEGRLGTRVEARDYVMKERTRVDGPWEHGRFIPDVDTALLELLELASKGSTMTELLNKNRMLVSRRHREIQVNIDSYLFSQRPVRKIPMVYLLLGTTYVGKSKFVIQESPDCFRKSNKLWYFDNYNGTDDILLDDYYGSLPFETLLLLLGNMSCRLPARYRDTPYINPKRVYITSNKLPHSWYSNVIAKKEVSYYALVRRFTHVFEFFSDTRGFYFTERPKEWLISQWK